MGVNGVSGLNVKDDTSLKEIERLRSTHPVYNEYKVEWDFFLAAYEGGKSFAKEENLHKHPREHNDDYQERVKRIHYLNYCEPIVDFFTDFIFGETIQRDGGSNEAFYASFQEDVNKKGADITEFMRDVCEDSQILGMVYVMVDAPKSPTDRKLSKAEEQKLGFRPYWVLVRPTEVLDWVTDQFDVFLYLKRVQLVSDFINGERRELERYTEWTAEEIKITDIDVTESGKAVLMPATILPNNLGEIPVEVFRCKKSKQNRFMGNSLLMDLAYNNREVMNLTSLLQEFLYRQCFNLLAVQTDQSLPVQEQQEGEVGTSNMLTYPKGADAPQYISPSSDPADKLMDERQRIVNEMYRRAAQDTVNELFNGSKSSGFSKAQSFSTTVPKIASRAETLQDGENRLMSLTMRYMRKDWDGKVKYKDRYEITNLTDAISQLTSIFRDLQLPSEKFAKQELKRIVDEFDGQIPADERQGIYAEIDKMDFTSWLETQKEALIGKTNSIAEQQGNKQTGMTTSQMKAVAEKRPVTGATKKAKG